MRTESDRLSAPHSEHAEPGEASVKKAVDALLQRLVGGIWAAHTALMIPSELSEPKAATQKKQTAQQREAIAATLILAVENSAPLRAAPRAQLKAEVDFSSESNFYSGFSTDVADGGLFLATLSLLPVGSVVQLKFSIPGAGEVEATGEVRWIRAFDEQAPYAFPGMGIRFIELQGRAKELIAGFVAQREPMFFPE